MKVWKISDFGGYMFNVVVDNAASLPPAIPWIEPSINNLHLESAYSFLVGNYECAIYSSCALLEHVLRLALVNDVECGLRRPESIKQIDKFSSLEQVVLAASGKSIFSGCDVDWWHAVAKNIRNKSAHYLLPLMLKKCANEPKLSKYIIDYDQPYNNDATYYDKYITDWGSFYHKAGRYLAGRLLSDATVEILKIIGNTKWQGDTSWWISQKDVYERFFNYSWSEENILESYRSAHTEFANHD